MAKNLTISAFIVIVLVVGYVGAKISLRVYQGHDPLQLIHNKIHTIEVFSTSVHDVWHLFHEDGPLLPPSSVTSTTSQKGNLTKEKNYDEALYTSALTLPEIVKISRLDRKVVSRFQLTKFIHSQNTPPPGHARTGAPIVHTATQRSGAVYRYPNNFAYSKHAHHPLVADSEVYKKYGREKNELVRLLNSSGGNRQDSVNSLLTGLSRASAELFRLRMSLVAKHAQYPPRAEILYRKKFTDRGTYEIVFFHWQPGPFELHQLGALYIPVGNDGVMHPVAIHPMGCGGWLGRNDKGYKLHSRMASLAANGVASVTLTGFCSHRPFTIAYDTGYARQHDALSYISSSALNNRDVILYSYIQFLQYLGEQFAIDKNNVATLGYSYGAVIAGALAPRLKAKYVVHVASPLTAAYEFLSTQLSEHREYKYVFARDDTAIPFGQVQSRLSEIEVLAQRAGLNFAKTVDVVQGVHDFGAEKSQIAVDWLLEKFGKRQGSYTDRASTFNFDVPADLKREMFEKDFHYMFSKAAVTAKSRYGLDASNTTREEYKKTLRGLLGLTDFQVGGNDQYDAKTFLLNSKSFSHGGKSYSYESWLVNFLDGLETVVVTLKPLESSAGREPEKVLLVNRDDFFQRLDLVSEHLEAGRKLLLHEGFGYGHTTDAQFPLGVNNGLLNGTGHTLMGMNVRILALLKLQHGPFDLIETSTLDMNVCTLLYAFLSDYSGTIKEHDTLVSFDDFVTSPNQPVIPPYLFLRDAYLKLDLEKLRQYVSRKQPVIIESVDPLVNYAASQ